MHINALNPTVMMDPSRIMNVGKGFELDTSWSEFNSVFRGVINKKAEHNFVIGFILVGVVFLVITGHARVICAFVLIICFCMHSSCSGFKSMMKPD